MASKNGAFICCNLPAGSVYCITTQLSCGVLAGTNIAPCIRPTAAKRFTLGGGVKRPCCVNMVIILSLRLIASREARQRFPASDSTAYQYGGWIRSRFRSFNKLRANCFRVTGLVSLPIRQTLSEITIWAFSFGASPSHDQTISANL